jgi:hypothetical protein
MVSDSVNTHCHFFIEIENLDSDVAMASVFPAILYSASKNLPAYDQIPPVA